MNSDSKAMDEILASIRQAVAEGPPLQRDPDYALDAPAPPPPVAPPSTLVLGLDAYMQTLLEPALKAWLDANLPEIVDRAVHAEIARLTGQPE